MPTYDYQIADRPELLTVFHSMTKSPCNWGELCEAAGLNPEDYPADTPVRRVQTGGFVMTSKIAPSDGGSCCGGACHGSRY
jgi:hypothetical protein